MTPLDRLKARLPSNMNVSDNVLQDALDSAKAAIMSARYPTTPWPTDDEGEPVMDVRYSDLQVRIAVELTERRGGSTQTSHGENSIDRSWENAGISRSLLSEVTPIVSVHSRGD